MRAQGAQQHPDSVIVELADDQHGVVHWGQLIERGIGRNAIAARLRSGFLHRVYRGVYAVGRRTLTGEGHYIAAVFAGGEGAALSHHSAATHLGLRSSASSRVAVTVPTRHGRKQRPGIAVHRCALELWETEIVDAIRTTTVARTLMDLAEQFPARVVESALVRAEQLRVLNLDAIDSVVAAHPHRVGARCLARILSVHPSGQRHAADDGIEDFFLAIVDDNNLRRPEIKPDIYVADRAVPYQPDFVWPPQRLIAETDGREVHHTPTAFEDDRAKSNALLLAGYVLLRFTYIQVTTRQDWVAGQLRAAGVPAG